MSVHIPLDTALEISRLLDAEQNLKRADHHIVFIRARGAVKKRLTELLEFYAGESENPETQTDLREAALRMQVCVANVLGCGGRTSEELFENLVEAQRSLAAATHATSTEFRHIRKKYKIREPKVD